jgi:hypothetical protein
MRTALMGDSRFDDGPGLSGLAQTLQALGRSPAPGGVQAFSIGRLASRQAPLPPDSATTFS